jgi:biotin operon repressor
MTEPQTSKDEQIGFHKGSIATLSKERAELARILGIVEQLLAMHVAELKKLGIDVTQQPEASLIKKDKKPIEDII